MRKKIMMLENGSRFEASRVFDEVKASITDFKKETVILKSKNVSDINDNWSVYKIINE